MSTQQLIYVKPAGPSKFWHNPDVKGYSNFPETTKSYPLFWSFDDHKFKFDDLSDKEVLELAEKCKLSYEDGENKGKVIQKFDLYHREDAFFNHSRLVLKITDDVTTFNINNPLDKLKLAAFKAYPFVAKSEQDKKNIASVRWVIVNKETEKQDQESKYITQKQIWKYFTGTEKERLSPEQMRSMAYAFNDKTTYFDNNASVEAIETYLMGKAMDTSMSAGTSNRERFLILAKLPKDELKARELVGKAAAIGVLRRTGEKWSYGGNELATGIENLVKYLLNPENAATFLAIQEEIKLKQRNV